MKKITIYRNQRTQGGAVEFEAWMATNFNNIEFVYGSGYSLESLEIEIPDTWTIDESMDCYKTIYDSNNWEVRFKESPKGNIYAITSEEPFQILIAKREKREE